MRVLLFSTILLIVLACGGKETSANQQTGKEIAVANKDSIGMADALHSFFKWYGETGEQLITKINFVDTKGKHPTLNITTLMQYLDEFKKSGAVCNEFVQNETIYYNACAQAWKNENSDEQLTGFDHDRYYCQQDGDVTEFLKAGVSYESPSDGRATTQLLLDPNGPNVGPRAFEMKREKGKWYISKILCQ